MSERAQPTVVDNGISSAMRMALHMFEQSSRRTGRTWRLLAAARPGDLIVTWCPTERERLLGLLRGAKKEDVEVIFLDPKRDPMWRQGTNPRGATLFDHGWIALHYQHRLAEIANDLNIWQAAMSMAPHPEVERGDMDWRYEEWVRG